MRRGICLALCLIILFSATAFAEVEEPEYQYSGDYCYYLQADGTASIQLYRGKDSIITIPETLNNSSVSTIDAWAFSYAAGLRQVNFGKNIVNIKPGAFLYCTELEAIEASDNPVYVSLDGVLFDAAAKELHTYPGGKQGKTYPIPKGAKAIGDFAFTGNETLAAIEIHEAVTDIGNHAFYGCSGLSGVAIPGSVKRIGDWAFSGCAALSEVKFADGLFSIGEGAFYGCSSLKAAMIPDSVASIGKGAFHECESLMSVKLPKNIAAVEDWLFFLCRKLTDVTVPDGVRTIGKYAFYGCGSLREMTLPESISVIEENAFCRCDGLKNIRIPQGVLFIGGGAFSAYDKLSAFEVAPDNKTYAQLGGVLFDKTKKLLHTYPGGKAETRYSIPQGIVSIGQDAFLGNVALREITIPESVVEIGRDAFYNCDSLESIHVAKKNKKFEDDQGVLFTRGKDILLQYPPRMSGVIYVVPAETTAIGDGAFGFCPDLLKITLCAGIKSIGDHAFSGSFIREMVIPEGVEHIGGYAFELCAEMQSITLPASLRSIGEDAFLDCPALVLSVAEGSYALQYAKENELQYILYAD